jgi:tRNA A-37 threonylcarbamoyl transferase component Bud32
MHCKTLPNRVGFTVMCALLPVWALITPTLLGLFSSLVMQHPVQSSAVFYLLWGMAAIPVLGILLTAYFEDDRIDLSKDTLAFPLFMFLRLRCRLNRTWQEIGSASLARSLDGKKTDLTLRFKSGEQLSLKSHWFKKEEMEQLLLSLDLWGVNCQRTPELVDYQRQLHAEITCAGKQSYTQMWEEELGRRFNATAFVPLEPGHTLREGQLKIVKQLAFGGLSAIYLAQRGELDLVVIKEAVVPSSSDEATKAKAEELFKREAALLVKLDHPHVARVLDHFVDEGRNYLMLEYINGQDLRQHVKQNGPQKENTVLNWALQVAEVLVFLHGQDPPIIHRDLTPDNLVLKNDGTVCVIDFGAANQFVGTATGTLVGKQSYIAPEQLRGKADLQSDLYSFGGTIYYLLTGKDPIPLMSAHPKEVLSDVSDAMDCLVSDLTAFDKEKRVSTAKDALQRLKAMDASKTPLLTGGAK